MSLIGEKAETKCVVNGRAVDVDELVESAIIDFECAMKSFWYLWEEYFSWIEAPDAWEHQYKEISAQITAHKMLMDRILDDLLAAYSNRIHR